MKYIIKNFLDRQLVGSLNDGESLRVEPWGDSKPIEGENIPTYMSQDWVDLGYAILEPVDPPVSKVAEASAPTRNTDKATTGS